MKTKQLIPFLLLFSNLLGQQKDIMELPRFKQVSHPFMPAITSRYFFFSNDGLVWFSTDRGLTSFDGSEVIYYSTPEETNRLGLNNINCIAEDSKHDFYIETSTSLIYFNRGQKKFSRISYVFKDIRQSKDLGNGGIFINKQGMVYFGVVSLGFFVYDPITQKTEHYNLDPSKPDSWEERINNSVYCIAPNANNEKKLWLGTGNGIYLFDQSTRSLTKKFYVTNPQYNPHGLEKAFYDIQKMDLPDDSTIWFNMWSGAFCKYDIGSGKVYLYTMDSLYLKGKQVQQYIIPGFARMSKDYYILALHGRPPCLFNIHTKQLTPVKIVSDSTRASWAMFAERDKNGNVWMLRNGQLYIDFPANYRLRSLVLKTAIEPHKNADELRGIYFDKTSGLYYGATRFCRGIHVFDKNFTPIKIIPAPLFSNRYTNNQTCTDRITKDGSGRFWTCGWEIYIMQPGKNQFEHIEKEIPSLRWIHSKGEFSDVVSTANGNILLQCSDETVYVIDHKTLQVDTVKMQPSHGKNSNYITSAPIAYDSTRNLIYVTNNTQLMQYDVIKKAARILPDTAMFTNVESEQKILSFSLDAKGRIWLLKQKYGIRIIDPETLTCMDSIPFGEKGLLPGNYTDVISGGEKYMLLRNTNGIVIYDLVRQLSFLMNETNDLSYMQPYALLYVNNYLVLGQFNRVEYFDLVNVGQYNFNVSPQLNSIKADSVDVYVGYYAANNTIALPHNLNNLTFSFSAPEFLFPERIEYAYQLTGVDNNWNYTNYFNRSVTYSHLPPGKYVFRLNAQIQGGNWKSSSREYLLSIEPAWWQTNWFIIACIVAACAVAFVLIRWRIKTVRKQEQDKAKQQQEKSRIEKEILELEAKALRAQMNPHFIFNCMNSIKSLIQRNEHEKAINYLTTFSKLLRTIFQNADKREITLHDEIETCRLYTQLESMRFSNRLTYNFDIAEEIDFKSVLVPPLILQPFIENAIWHGLMPKAEGGMLYVHISEKESKIYCVVEDNGIGRSVSMQNKFNGTKTEHQSRGIRLTQTRLELNSALNQRNATVEIIDKATDEGKAVGTKVVLVFDEE